MEILVCMKQVPDDSVEIRLGTSGEPDLSQAEPQGNAFDTYALELATRFVEANGGTITVATVGTEADKVCLKNSLAVGAKNAAQIEGPEKADASVTAAFLAAGIKKIEADAGKQFDMVLCGRESTDYIGGEVGEILAEKLGLPFVTDVVEVTPGEGKVTLKKELETGYAMVEAALPCIMTISKPNYDPRYPSIKSKLAARRAVIPAIGKDALALGDGDADVNISHISYKEPPKRTAGVKIQEEDPEAALAKAFEVLAADKVL